MSDLMSLIKADAAERAGLTANDVHVVHREAVTWRDGSLGCPEPGMSYPQVIVPGQHVIVEVRGARYDYRAGRGRFKLCPGGPLDSGSEEARRIDRRASSSSSLDPD